MENIIKCEKCGEVFDNAKIKANHIRWKHKDQTAYIQNSKLRGIEISDKIHGKKIKESVKCSHTNCKNIINVEYREGKKKDKYFCSIKCANSRGKRSDETKRKISESLRKEAKVFTCTCKMCESVFQHNKIKMFCNTNCYKQFKRKNKTELQNYRSEATFNFNIFDYPNEFDLDLIKEYGFYSAANRGGNLNGISRDHMYSCKMGLINNVDPAIIRHPANCKLMRHNDNVSKNSECSITLEELLKRIDKWNSIYGETI